MVTAQCCVEPLEVRVSAGDNSWSLVAAAGLDDVDGVQLRGDGERESQSGGGDTAFIKTQLRSYSLSLRESKLRSAKKNQSATSHGDVLFVFFHIFYFLLHLGCEHTSTKLGLV